MPLFDFYGSDIQSEEEKHGLQPLSPDVPQAQAWDQEGGPQQGQALDGSSALLRESTEDNTPIPRVKLKHKYNKPEPEQQGTFNPYQEGGLTGRQLSNLRRSFTEDDPLLCIDDDEMRSKIESIAATFGVEDGERIRKAVALAHYYSMGNREKTGFIFDNLDAAIEEFEGKPMSVEQAYESVKQIYNPKQEGIWGNRVVAAVTAGGAEIDKTTANAISFLGKRAINAGQDIAFNFLDSLPSVLRLIGHTDLAVDIHNSIEQGKDAIRKQDYGQQFENAIQQGAARQAAVVERWARENMDVPENWVTNSDDLVDWVTNAGLSLINYAPQLGAQLGLMATTGGVWSLGTVYGITGYYDIKGDLPDMSEGDALLYGLGIGLINSVLEKISFEIVRGRITKDYALNGIKKGLLRTFAYLGIGASIEGAEEMLEEYSENVLDIAMGRRGDKEEREKWDAKRWMQEEFRGVLEAGFLGFSTGFGMASPSVYPLKMRAAQNEATMNFVRDQKAKLDAKESLTAEEEGLHSVLSAAVDSNNPVQVERAAQAAVLNHVRRVQQEKSEVRKRYEAAEARFNEAKAELDAVSQRPMQDAGNRTTAVEKFRSAQTELESAKAELESERKEFVRAFPEEETVEERAIREAEEIHTRRDLTQRIDWNLQDTVDTVNELAKQYPTIPIHAVMSFDALPEEVKADLERRGINRERADAAWYNGEVFVIEDKVRPGDVEKKIMHEVIGHEGLRRVFGDQFNGFLNDVYQTHSKEIEEMGLAALYNTKPDTEAGRQYLAEEYLARMAESDVKPSWWKNFLAQIRSILRQFYPNLHFSDAEIESALVRSARAVRLEQRLADVAPESRFALGGEMGASRLNNQKYNIALEMEEAGKDERSIWLATGWERGKDGKWRFELPDIKVKLNILNTDELSENQGWYLWDFAEGKEIFEAYPELKDLIVRIEELPPRTNGQYDPYLNEITLNRNGLIGTAMDVLKWREADVASSNTENMEANAALSAIRKDLAGTINDTLVHEVQHAIQEIEGFAKGTNLSEARNVNHETEDPVYAYKEEYGEKIDRGFVRLAEISKDELNLSKEKSKELVNSIFDLIVNSETDLSLSDDFQSLVDRYAPNVSAEAKTHFLDVARKTRIANDYYDRYLKAMSADQTYKRFAGEVESRNIQKRAEMSDDERRRRPPSQTEDVHRAYQIVRFSVAGADENLIVVHNVSEQKLRDAIKLGALPVPSLGIIDAEKSDFNDYGRITLIADKSTIDPKNRKNKVYDADVYSPRRPFIERVFSDEEFDRALKIISPYEMNEPDSALSIQHLVQQHRYRAVDTDFEQDLKDNDAVKAWYADTRQGVEKFEDWWQRVATPALDLNPKERIFDGFTNAGNRRYLPANLETIVRLMTKQVKNGEGTHWGFGSYRAAVAKQFKSISEIQKNRDKIISFDDYKVLKDEIQKEIDTLESEMEKAKLEDAYWGWDTANDALLAFVEGDADSREFLYDTFGKDNPIYEKMAVFLSKLRNLPTPLFEAKPQRAVYLNEFKAAVVPAETSENILNALRDAGIDVYTYANDEARKATLQMVTKERNLRFSLENYSEQDKSDFVKMLKPKWIQEAFVEPSEVKAYLESLGETGIDENDAWALYHMAGSEIRAEKKKADDKKRDNWIYENDLLYHDAVDYGGLDFKIIPSLRFLDNDEWPGTFIADSWRKRGKKRPQGKNESGLRYNEYLRRREAELTSGHQTGITSDDLAKYIARIRGGDELDIEEQIIEHFRYMNRPKLWDQYYKYKKEQNYRNKIEQNEAEEEFAEYKREQIQQKVEEIIANKGQITEEWAIANPDVFAELYRLLMKEEPPKSRKPSKENLEAINAALANEDVNAATYKAVRRALTRQFQQRLTALREEMNDKNANAVKLQREAAAFAEENLPPELRGMFTRGIIKLLNYGTSPSKNFPEGRRMHEFYQLQDEILKASQTKRTEDSIGHIREMLDAVKMKRNWKGIPVSVIPSEQARVERIRKIIDMSAASVANAIEYNNSRILELEDGVDAEYDEKIKKGEDFVFPDIEHLKQKYIEDNALLELFGNLEYRKPDSVLKAEDFLQDLIKGGKAKFKSLLAQQAGRVMVMRQQAVSEITGGKNVTTTGGAVESKDAKNHTQYILKNMHLGSLLRLVAAKAGIDFDSTVAGKLLISTEKSTQKEMTANRHLQEDFDDIVAEIIGTVGKNIVSHMLEKGRFLKGLSKVEQKTGVFKTQFSRQKVIDPLDAPIVQVGRSSSKIHLIPVEDYTRRVQKGDGTFEEVTMPGVRSILRAIDNGGTFEIGDGVNLDETGVWMLRKQLEDYDAGIDRRFDFFKDEIDAESAEKLKEDSEKDKLAVIFRGKNVESKQVEVPLSQGTALQILLTWEQEDYRANMKWNGWTEESIKQIKKFLKPETLQLGYWMRDYFAKQRSELDEAVVKRYGAHLPENQNYWPGRFSGSRTSIGTGGMRGAGTMSINPNFLIARKFHLNPLDMDVDASSVFFDGQITQNHFLAWTDTIRDLREVFGDSSVQDAINENFGKDVTKNLVERIATIAQGGSNNGFLSSFFNRLYRFWVPAKIALNQGSFIKQGLATLSYMNFMPVDEYVKYMSRANMSNMDYKAFVQMALNSDYLKNRWAGGLDKDLIYMMQNTRDTVPYSPLGESLLSLATYMTKRTDRWSALHGGFAVYQYNLDQARKSGLSEKEAQERARRAWMRATDSSQQSGYLKDLNYYQQNQGLVRFYTAFLTSPIQVMNLQLQTLNDIKYNSDNAAAKKKIAKQIFVNHVVVMTLMQFTTDMVRAGLNPFEWWDDAEFEDYFTAWLFGPFEGLFFAGKEAKSTINLLADMMIGRPKKTAQSTSAVQLVSETNQNFNRIWNDLKDEEISEKDIADGLSFAGDLGMLYGATPAPGAAAVGSTGAVVNAAGTLYKRILKAIEDDEDGKKTSKNKTSSRRGSGSRSRRR